MPADPGSMKERLPFGTLHLYARGTKHACLPGYLPILAQVPVGAERILDVGTGPGDVAARLMDLHPSAQVVGADVDPRMVKVARKRHAESERLRFQVADAGDLPFEDGSFDLAWTSESFHHWNDQDAGLKEVLRVLRPGGGFWIVEARADMDRRHFREAFGIPAVPGLFGLMRLAFRRHGYTDVGLARVAERLVAAGFGESRVDHHGAWGRVIGKKAA